MGLDLARPIVYAPQASCAAPLSVLERLDEARADVRAPVPNDQERPADHGDHQPIFTTSKTGAGSVPPNSQTFARQAEAVATLGSSREAVGACR
jgi:hypothetical protein